MRSSGGRFLLAVAVALLAGCASIAIPIGGIVPTWKLPTSDGDTLSEDALRGRPGLVIWLDPMCPEVQDAALPGGALRRMESRWMPTDSAWVVYVAARTRADQVMDPQMWRPWMKEMRLRGPVLVDSSGILSRTLGAELAPAAAVVDGDGVLRWRGPMRSLDSTGVPLASQVLDSVLGNRALPAPDNRADEGCRMRDRVW